MRKRLITPTPENIRTRGDGWLDVERAAVVEVTSEDKDFPVEAAFVSGDTRGWRAAAPGSQTIRLIFDRLQTLRCISLVFEENETGRTREFVDCLPLGDKFAVNLSYRCAIGDSGAQNHAPTANPLASKCVRRKCYESCSRSRCQQFVANQRR